jgi:hypothetical protein
MKPKTLRKSVTYLFENVIQSQAEIGAFTADELDALFYIMSYFADLRLAGNDIDFKIDIWETISEKANEQLIKLKEKQENSL